MNVIIDEKELQDFIFSLGETWSEDTCKKVVEKQNSSQTRAEDSALTSFLHGF
jgi:hypothetical protein